MSERGLLLADQLAARLGIEFADEDARAGCAPGEELVQRLFDEDAAAGGRRLLDAHELRLEDCSAARIAAAGATFRLFQGAYEQREAEEMDARRRLSLG